MPGKRGGCGIERGNFFRPGDALYDNFFIDTCDEWVIPYIAIEPGIEGIGILRNRIVKKETDD